MLEFLRILFGKPSDRAIMEAAQTSDGLFGSFDTSGQRCFTGAGDVFNCHNTDYKFVCVLGMHEKFVFTCNTIPEITEWCMANNCIYGWARVVAMADHPWVGNALEDFKLFIATKNKNTYSLIKLTWL
jgi:hypothetical protein